jgi:hypothetical protein
MWCSRVDESRIFISSDKQRWGKQKTVDLVMHGMRLRSEEHVEDNVKDIAKKLGNRGLG